MMFSSTLFSAAALFFLGASSVIAAPVAHVPELVKVGTTIGDISVVDRRDAPATPSVPSIVFVPAILGRVTTTVNEVGVKIAKVLSATDVATEEIKPLLKELGVCFSIAAKDLINLKDGKLPDIDIQAAVTALGVADVKVHVTEEKIAHIVLVLVKLIATVIIAPLIEVVIKVPTILKAVVVLVSELKFLIGAVTNLCGGVLVFLEEAMGTSMDLATLLGLTGFL